MNSKVIGFVGLDVQDTMLYLSRIFLHMGKRVLLADYSESQALYYSIPLVQGMNAQSMLIEYRDTFFTCVAITEKELREFDVILLFFGFMKRRELELCTHMIYTTDFERNHLEKLPELRGNKKEYIQLVYRNTGRQKQGGKQFPFAAEIKEDCQYYCNDSSREKRLRRQCQYNDAYGFRGISSGFRRYLYDTVKAVFPEEAMGKEFAASFRRAEMGV